MNNRNIVPICLYQNSTQGYGYISLPLRGLPTMSVPSKNRTDTQTDYSQREPSAGPTSYAVGVAKQLYGGRSPERYTCNTVPGLDFIGKIYVINPDVRPIPPGSILLCVKNGKNTTLSVKPMYDPFDITGNCTRFIAWVEPVPNSTKLYLYKNGGGILPSFSRREHLEELLTLYVLTGPEIKGERVPGFLGIQENFPVVNGVPQFRFTGYQGRCLPDPNGIPLDECIVLHVQQILDRDQDERTLLAHLRGLGEIEKKQSPVVLYIFLMIVLIVGIIILSYKK